MDILWHTEMFWSHCSDSLQLLVWTANHNSFSLVLSSRSAVLWHQGPGCPTNNWRFPPPNFWQGDPPFWAKHLLLGSWGESETSLVVSDIGSLLSGALQRVGSVPTCLLCAKQQHILGNSLHSRETGPGVLGGKQGPFHPVGAVSMLRGWDVGPCQGGSGGDPSIGKFRRN